MSETTMYNRLIDELKANNISLKEVAKAVNLDYTYLSSMRANRTVTPAVYKKVLAFAKKNGIELSESENESVVSDIHASYPASDAAMQIITLRVKLIRNKIAGVEWDMTN